MYERVVKQIERLTLEEAIKYTKEAVKTYRAEATYNFPELKEHYDNCLKCANQHDLLAEWLEELKSYKEAEKQGLLVRLPCKVGDTVYVPTRNFISELRITLISVDTSDGAMYFSWMLNAGIYPNLKGFSGYELGKTVFLAREEAEKKLKEMKNDKT